MVSKAARREVSSCSRLLWYFIVFRLPSLADSPPAPIVFFDCHISSAQISAVVESFCRLIFSGYGIDLALFPSEVLGVSGSIVLDKIPEGPSFRKHRGHKRLVKSSDAIHISLSVKRLLVFRVSCHCVGGKGYLVIRERSIGSAT